MIWDINFLVFKGKQEASNDGHELDPAVTRLNLLVVWLTGFSLFPHPSALSPSKVP